MITTNSASTTYYGFRSNYGDGAFEVVGNAISGFTDGYGMYIYYSDATPAAKGLVANNVVSSVSSGT